MTGAIITGREVHPVIPLLEPEIEQSWLEIDKRKVEEFYSVRAEVMRMEAADPFRNGYEPSVWKLADERLAAFRERFPIGVVTELDLGGNRASKSERRAKRLVQNMVKNPGWRAWALQSNETSSRQNQQSIIYKYLPAEWRPESGAMRGGRTTKIVYKQATGFTENVLVCPNGSECRFKFYGMDVSGVEGAELNEAWADELITPDWIEALIFRLVTRNGLLGITFTPIEGYSATVKAYLDGALTVEEVIAELLPVRDASGAVTDYEKVPRVQENTNAVVNGQRSKAVIIYFHTADNPYGNYASMKETLEGASREKILTRAYGVPSKTFGAALPMFRTNVHVLGVAQWEKILRDYPNGTRYHLVDPCSGRNWFMIWVYCPQPGKKIIYREWPSYGHTGAYIQGIGDPGEWTIPGKADDGEQGPAQKAFGFGLERYKQEIESLEGKEEIFERYMDSRTANSPTATREGSTTLIEQMSEMDMDFLGTASEQTVFSNSGDGSIDLLNSELYYDVDVPIGDYSPRLSRINAPNLHVLETCPNVIYSMSSWSGRDGQRGSSKDPIDVARMIVLNELDYIDESMLRPRQPWMNQFRKVA